MTTVGKRVLMPEIVLIGLIRTPDTSARRMLDKIAQERGFKLSDVDQAALNQIKMREARPADFIFTLDTGASIQLSDELLKAIDDALTIAQANDEVWIGTEHLLSAFATAGISTAGLLQTRGITPQALTPYLKDRSIAKRMTTRDWAADARSGVLTPMFFRETLLREMISVLSQSGNRHVLLVGNAGSGRKSLAYSLALLIAEGKGPQGVASLIEIAESALLDNPVEALRAGVKQAIGGALFLPNVARFFDRFIADKIKNVVQKAFLDKDPIVIATATEAEYNESLKSLTGVYVLRVPNATNEETTGILGVLKPQFENEYGLSIASGSPSTVAVMAGRYLSSEALPGAAVKLLHRSAALVRMSTQTELAYRPEAKPDATLDPDDVMLALSQMTGIPATKLGQDERTKYAQMAEFIKSRIIGQDEAVLAVSRAVKTARVGLKDPKRPIGSFLFLGPTGVGKTELAKALAEFMFGSEDNLIALDMTEYQQEDSLNRLIGSAPGYVGFEGGGQLTERVRQEPYSIVLFDECEKAHPRILDVLLQMMDEGRLTDGQGRVAKFSDAVIILTSNLGAKFLVDQALGEEQAEELAMEVVKQHFRPEFLNRLDEIIMFNALSPEAVRKILDLLLKKELKLAAERGLTLDITEAARVWLMSKNDHPEWGARPLRRIIQKYVREPLADYLLDKNPSAGTKIKIEVAGDALKFVD
ncbi:MAG: ATP-dependent Clp protease ATP-binding subunit [Thermoflexales bacterium]|nr:ATP-dependent Clp protease ATP-binding subunit [Thermoflexales bacterium]